MRYTFGIDELAAQRLQTIAGFFNPLANKFIRTHFNKPSATVLDLGCGPGFTTQMLARATNCEVAFGLDNARSQIDLARALFGGLRFIEHDVTQTPFPMPGDVMYSRFLLSHLNDIGDLLAKWVSQLNEGGLLFIEELEDISTDVDVFARYIEVSAGLVGSQGAEMFVGKTLAEAAADFNVIHEESAVLPVPDKQAATWFYPNTVSVWKKEPYVIDLLSQTERETIAESLLNLRQSQDDQSRITWKMRRIVIGSNSLH